MEQKIMMILKDYGLSEKETKVYLFLVGKNELTAYKIAKETRIHRSTCYDILERLISKGFASKIGKENKSVFSANEIRVVVSGLKEKENLLLSMIPKLKEIKKEDNERIRFLDSASSQREFNVNILEMAKKRKISFFYCISGGPSQNNYETDNMNLLIERLVREAVKKRLFKSVDYKGIWDYRFRGSRFIKMFNKLGKNKFLSLPTKATAIIFDNYVCFLYTGKTPKVIEIKNKLVSEEMGAYFLHLWTIAK